VLLIRGVCYLFLGKAQGGHPNPFGPIVTAQPNKSINRTRNSAALVFNVDCSPVISSVRLLLNG
jgi:hypothetical protein